MSSPPDNQADQVFRTYFAPWYPPERPPLHQGVYADLEEVELSEGTPISVLQDLDPQSMKTVKEQLAGMGGAYQEDWPTLLGVSGTPDRGWLAAFENHFDQAAVEELHGRSVPENFSNPLLIMCCECGCALADVLQAERPALQWLYEWPYWDSSLFDLNSRVKLNVFHWAIKRLARGGAGESLIKKVDASLARMDAPA